MKVMYFKHFFFKLFFLLIVCCVHQVSLAQSRNVSGKVSADTGEGLPGVNVLLKGSTTGTTT
jgi:hypothetical protein